MSEKLYRSKIFVYNMCMKIENNLKILGLSKKEEKVLVAIIAGLNTPLLISNNTKVTRPAVYEILKKLKTRGITATKIVNGKKYWHLVNKDEIDQSLYDTKKFLLSITEGAEEVKGVSDGTVVVHRGKEAVFKVIHNIVSTKSNERLVVIQGNASQQGWNKIMSAEKINEFNNTLRKNEIITEAILPQNWFEDHIKDLGDKEGLKWAKDFSGRAYATYEIGKEYFNHAGQIFIFNNSLYLMSMNEELIIEVKNSELQKMIKQIFNFIENNANKVNVNDRIEKIIKRLEGYK